MARTLRNAKLDTRNARLKLVARKEPYWTAVSPGEALGYYRPSSGGTGTWWVKFRDPSDGARRKAAIGAADDFAEADDRVHFSYAQAMAKARNWFIQTRADSSGERVQCGPFTVRDAWEGYIADAERRGMKGVQQTRAAAGRHILPALGEIAVEKLTRARIEKWHSALSKTAAALRTKTGAEDRAARPLPKTDDEIRARKESANRVLSILKAMLNHAKSHRLTLADGAAWREARPFKGTTTARVRFLTPEEAQRLANVCPPDFRLLVEAALHTGARLGELARLEVQDFNAIAGTVLVAESKSGKPRHIVLTDEGVAFFSSQVAGRKAGDIIFQRRSCSTRQGREPDLLRPWRKSEQFRPMAEACEAAGLDPLTFHELRHTYASMLVNKGVPLAYVGAQLGHSDTRMVEKHYGHLAPSALAESIRTLAPKLNLGTPPPIAALKIQIG